MVFGEADRLCLPMFQPVARFGVHVVPGLGRHRFSLIHVADLVNLLILAAERGRRLQPAEKNETSAAGYYFAACPEHPTYAQLGRMVGTALGRRRVWVLFVPPMATWLVAAAAEAISRTGWRPFGFSFDKAREARAGSWLCSPQRATDELGFSVAAPLADRLRQTAQWYLENGWLQATDVKNAECRISAGASPFVHHSAFFLHQSALFLDQLRADPACPEDLVHAGVPEFLVPPQA
jgi:nucleoside-diphosphate-sugar epimerase